MRRTTGTYRSRAVALAAIAALGAGLLSGCADDGDSDTNKSGGGGEGGSGKTKIIMGLFGTMGFKEAGLYDEYMKLHPDIKIEQTVIERNENYYPQLLNHLSTGSGLADVQGIEVANIAEVVQTQADKFVDLSKTAGVKKENWLDWKWQQSITKDGKAVGLATDIGPMAICYRKDLFQKAGLPTDREKVAALWAGDWNKYLDAGKEYMKKAPKGTAFVDSAGGVFNAVVAGNAERYYNKSGKIIYKDSPAVKDAWKIATEAATGKVTAKLQQFQKTWDQGYANGQFATVSCPPWMLGYIQEKAGAKAKDQWDVAAAPKPGNWGGTFLGVPQAGKNKEEAAKLVAWLTAPEQQAKLFKERGSWPSSQASYSLPDVKDAKHPYFANAPIGSIFTKAAQGIPVQTLGAKDQIINQNLVDIGILQVDQQGKSPEAGWKAATKTIDNALDQ